MRRFRRLDYIASTYSRPSRIVLKVFCVYRAVWRILRQDFNLKRFLCLFSIDRHPERDFYPIFTHFSERPLFHSNLAPSPKCSVIDFCVFFKRSSKTLRDALRLRWSVVVFLVRILWAISFQLIGKVFNCRWVIGDYSVFCN